MTTYNNVDLGIGMSVDLEPAPVVSEQKEQAPVAEPVSPQKEAAKKIAAEIAAIPTASGKIRFLNSKGLTRYQIAKILGIRYQHVRNVLITPVKNPRV